MDNNFITFENVNFRYESDDEEVILPLSLKDINLKIDRSEFVAVLGHNGSGKSTLAKAINAIIVPTSGKVTVCGMDTSDEELKYRIRENVGMVFQNPDNQIVATIVEDDVAFGPENLGVEPDEIRRRVDESLKEVGMYEFRNFEPHKLSGGQKQRVAIAGVLAMHTDAIVLDEPTAMLDPRGRKDVIDTVLRLNKQENKTVVLITHYMDEAVLADRVIVMDNGRIIMDGKPSEVFSKVEQIKKAGLDVPQVTEFANELKKCGVAIDSNILTVEECVAQTEKLLIRG
ncbi:MAG: energy-coupling factor transporter ATPase [Clostridia bacterium]|nr:energy-coupling factor transporter ATPase [Clostridia bacterium]